MIRLIILALATFGLMSASTYAQKFEEIELPRYWRGGAYTSQFNDKFLHCVAATGTSDGLLFLVSLSDRNDWILSISSGEWLGDSESDVDIRYRFNRSRWVKATARSISPETVMLVASDSSDFIENFRRRSVLEVEIYGKRIPLSLSGTTKLTDALRQCVTAHVPEDYDPNSNLVEDAEVAGTGIMISSDGYVLTNNHVVEECEAVHIVRNGQEAITATIEHTDAENDIALLKVDATFAPHEIAAFRAGRALRHGEPVYVFGYPLAGALSAGGNFVLGNVTALSGLLDDERYVQISAPVQPGNSGGPLLDSSGLLVGLVSMRIDDIAVMRATGALPQNINFALKRGPTINFLEQNDVDYNWTTTVKSLDPTDIADKSVQFSVQVACNLADPLKDMAKLQ